ncbi:MAG: DUF4834 family protein [Duncaniella sp.]|nr:DUF4834 family protein [Duncaniella sp.]HBI58340.1 hypothetical protein [Porphyromonadaceae bacterium]
MLTFLFLIILFFILWPVIKTAYAVHKARNQARDFFNQARTGYNQGYNQYNERPGGWSRNAAAMRPKIFTRDMGEYIDFEEIDSSPSTGETSNTRTSYSSESFVSDAEWEDIDNK